MLNDKGPILFINSVTTQVNESSDQKIYDSRNAPKVHNQTEECPNRQTNQDYKTQQESNKLEFLETRKLNNIIEMYNKNRPVLCNIVTNEREVVGIPYKKDDNKLFISISEEKDEELNINEINEIIIIKF